MAWMIVKKADAIAWEARKADTANNGLPIRYSAGHNGLLRHLGIAISYHNRRSAEEALNTIKRCDHARFVIVPVVRKTVPAH